MIAFIKLSIVTLLLALSSPNSSADEIDSAFLLWKETLETSAKKLGEQVVLTLDRNKGRLIVEKEFQLNPFRKNTQSQSVLLKNLSAEIELTGVAKLPEPWIRIPTKNNQKNVSNTRRVVINEVEVEEVTKTQPMAFIVIPCHRSDLKKAKEQGELFLSLATKK